MIPVEQNSVESKSGILDDKVILRFTHTSDNAAGTETHLECLNKILLLRNRMKIIFFYMPEHSATMENISIGKGNLIRIPLKFTINPQAAHVTLIKKILLQCSYVLSGHDCFNPLLKRAVNFQSTVEKIVNEFHIDLAINHFPGSHGSLLFMKELSRRKVPVLVINHFNNRWYDQLPIRKQLFYATTAAGLSNVNVPDYLKSRFVNLSNGIDTDFFNPEQIEQSNINKKVLLLPARILPKKGHLDLLKVSLSLKNQGFDCLTVFAGKIYKPDFKTTLDTFIESNNLADRVLFTGVLTPELLRKWYIDSTVVVLPTYHDEGLPRVILESQAMKIPPVCYSSGGVPESIRQNETGFYVKTGDISNLQKYIVDLLTDETRRTEMGKSGRDFVVANFSLNAMATRHEQLYARMCNKGVY